MARKNTQTDELILRTKEYDTPFINEAYPQVCPKFLWQTDVYIYIYYIY